MHFLGTLSSLSRGLDLLHGYIHCTGALCLLGVDILDTSATRLRRGWMRVRTHHVKMWWLALHGSRSLPREGLGRLW